MKNGVTIALIVVGGCLLFGPVLVNVYTSNKDKDRVAEFYTRNTNAAVLPRELAPSGYGFPGGGMLGHRSDHGGDRRLALAFSGAQPSRLSRGKVYPRISQS
jgi:hypothetical protein